MKLKINIIYIEILNWHSLYNKIKNIKIIFLMNRKSIEQQFDNHSYEKIILAFHDLILIWYFIYLFSLILII